MPSYVSNIAECVAKAEAAQQYRQLRHGLRLLRQAQELYPPVMAVRCTVVKMSAFQKALANGQAFLASNPTLIDGELLLAAKEK